MAIHDAYSDAEIKFLKENYKTASWDDLLVGINSISAVKRDKQSIKGKASALGLKRDEARFGRFTVEEDDLVREVYAISGDWELENNIKRLIESRMPHRSVKSIQCRAHKLGLHIRDAWSEKEKAFVVENFYTMTMSEIAKELGRTDNAVYLMTKKLNLGGAPMFKYTDNDFKFVADHYLNMSDEEIGRAIHRAGNSIKEFRRAHGLYRRDPDSATHYQGIMKFINAHNADWKKRSMLACGYRCVLTNGTFNDIHHLYSKNLILNAVLDRLSIPYDVDINTLEDETKQRLLDEFFVEQDKHPLGVCLRGDIHRAFHVLYGFGNNTPEQFYKFAEAFPQSVICKHVA